MDDLGAEHLSELSVSDKNVKLVDVKSPDTIAPAAVTAAAATSTNPPINNSESRSFFSSGYVVEKDSHFDATPRRRFKDRAIVGSQTQNYHLQHNKVDEEEEASLSSSDGKEKTDATPENVKKIDDVIQPNENHVAKSSVIAASIVSKTGMNSDSNMAGTAAPLSTTPNSTIADDDESSAASSAAKQQQCLAFTIDFGDSSTKDPNSAAAAKYKSMVERFQNRHKRGASMSKLEGTTENPPSNNETQTPMVPRSPRAPSASPLVPPDSTSKVKMRPRDRSTSRLRDASKRHSWSPRSSTADPLQQQQNHNQNHPKSATAPKSPVTPTTTATTKKPKPKPSPLPMPPAHEPRRDRSTSKPFTPRSTAMQMALQKIDFLCPQPPLDDYHHLAMNDNISEAGTYTLDGDNYTEEQKELMNIDKANAANADVSSGGHLQPQQQQRPKDLPLNNSQTPTVTTTVASSESRRSNNVLEVNYYHDAASYKSKNKTSYLEKIKSKVKNITAKQQQEQQKPQESPPSDADVGTFTSVTTSGVLAKQATLDSRPKLTRRSSLSTSQIDSSEYVSTESKLKSNSGASYNGGYTDLQKAGYRLNVFTNQTDSQILSAIGSPESPVSKISDTAVLKTAQTKNDWIQEWARNARAMSVASAIKTSPNKQTTKQQQMDIMSRSFTNAGGEEEILTDDSLVYRNKTIDRFRMGDFDYASDPNVSAQKPPKSPTKIPSPLHSIGRARSASQTRASLHNILQEDPNNTDLYLQKTAAAISNLQQSLSRKNSLKSPPSSRDSPKKLPTRHHTTTHQYYSADEYSPQHSIEAKVLLSNTMHKRAANNLMTNSYHEQLVLDVKIPRARKNSYDAQALTVSPAARRHHTVLKQQQQYYGGNIDQTRIIESSIKQKQQSLSPLRRSSSFSAKCKSTGANKRPTVTQYTPPAARHNYMGPPVGAAPIKKSASSTTFRHVYSDYDDNVAYYINDEDDLVDVEYYESSDEDINSTNVDEDYADYDDDVSQHIASESIQSADVPLSNTRYNKALLMRIERSKQKVAGNNTGGNQQQLTGKHNLLAGGGMVACPNTPELPRRAVKSAPRSSMRQSMPRDSSLNRMTGHIPNSLASAKKQILQTANAVTPSSNTQPKRVQPKYLDISKYKPAQGNSFLRKNDAKSTLKPEIRRSPSSASMGLTRAEPTRTSNRSVKSATSGRGTSAARRDASASKQKEVELAMWKRRATYDPMRAAAEDRRKKEEAKKSAQGGQQGGVTESSTVTRSQSFHYGVASLSGNGQPSAASNQQSLENRWALTSNESSDEEHAFVSSSTNRS